MENEIQNFFVEIEVEDVYKRFNNIESYQLDNIHKEGSKCIDSIVVSIGIMEYVEGYQLMNYNDIVELDHRAYIIDVAIGEYFDEEFSS